MQSLLCRVLQLHVPGSYLAIYEKLKQRNGLLCTILVHARHVEVIKEDHELLAHGRPICILGTLLCPILQP